jgi:hypothetical protein
MFDWYWFGGFCWWVFLEIVIIVWGYRDWSVLRWWVWMYLPIEWVTMAVWGKIRGILRD